MGLHIGEVDPDFTADTSVGKISFHDRVGSARDFFFGHSGELAADSSANILSWRYRRLRDPRV